MKTSIIVAASSNLGIGINNTLPWHIPDDLRYFRKMTLTKPMIMGRKTFESLNIKPLPGRPNIIVTKNDSWHFEHRDVHVKNSIESAYDHAKFLLKGTNENEIMIIGGGQIFEQTLPICDRIYLTKIHKNFEADSFFPKINPKEWREISCEKKTIHLTKNDEVLHYEYTILDRTST